MFQTSSVTLHHSPDCHIDCLVEWRRLPIDVASFCGSENGIFCIIRQVATDCVFCHMCCKTLIEKKVEVSMDNWEPSFTISGFSNWKDTTRAFKKHDNSEVHNHAVEKLYILPSTTKDIGESYVAIAT